MARQAYDIVHGADEPCWDDLSTHRRAIMQFIASHVAVEHEARIAQLEANLRGRDDFIVREGLWLKFVDQLPK